jgi:hypothetical protein
MSGKPSYGQAEHLVTRTTAGRGSPNRRQWSIGTSARINGLVGDLCELVRDLEKVVQPFARVVPRVTNHVVSACKLLRFTSCTERGGLASYRILVLGLS